MIKKEKICILIDTAIPDDSNINTKETEKLSKYKDLEIEVSRMWKLGTKILPVITGVIRMIKKGLEHSLQLLPGHCSTTDLQQVTLTSTADSVGRVLGKIAL